MELPHFQRVVDFDAAIDQRKAKPNCGIHGVNLRMALVGPEGAASFVLFTNWHLPAVQAELEGKLSHGDALMLLKPYPSEVSYHHRKPTPGASLRQDCPYHGKCWLEVSSSWDAQKIFEAMLAGGSDAVWAELEQRYRRALL